MAHRTAEASFEQTNGRICVTPHETIVKRVKMGHTTLEGILRGIEQKRLLRD
jgi:hypothetical protein